MLQNNSLEVSWAHFPGWGQKCFKTVLWKPPGLTFWAWDRNALKRSPGNILRQLWDCFGIASGSLLGCFRLRQICVGFRVIENRSFFNKLQNVLGEVFQQNSRGVFWHSDPCKVGSGLKSLKTEAFSACSARLSGLTGRLLARGPL